MLDLKVVIKTSEKLDKSQARRIEKGYCLLCDDYKEGELFYCGRHAKKHQIIRKVTRIISKFKTLEEINKSVTVRLRILNELKINYNKATKIIRDDSLMAIEVLETVEISS